MSKKLLISFLLLGITVALFINLTRSLANQGEEAPQITPESFLVFQGTVILVTEDTTKEKTLKEAMAKYKRAIKINPNYAEAYAGIGNVYELMADKEFKKFLKKNPEYKNKCIKGEPIDIADKIFHDAISYWKKAIELDPNYAAPHYRLGSYYYHTAHNYELAIKEFEKTLELDPEHKFAREDLKEARRKIRREKEKKEWQTKREELNRLRAKTRERPEEITQEELDRIKYLLNWMEEYETRFKKELEEREKEFKERMKKLGITEEDLIEEAIKDGMTREEAEELFLK